MFNYLITDRGPIDICGEIQYDGVHSDICIGHDMTEFTCDDEQRKFLHDNLDEWLNKSKGEGFFYVGNIYDLIDNFKEDN